MIVARIDDIVRVSNSGDGNYISVCLWILMGTELPISYKTSCCCSPRDRVCVFAMISSDWLGTPDNIFC
jgi:hypothetical protein